MKKYLTLLAGIATLGLTVPSIADEDDHKRKGLNEHAKHELVDAGVTKYVDRFWPAVSQDVGDGWIKHTYAPNPFEGPICIAGTPYSVFTKVRNPKKLMIFLQGGGACWQDFYFCNVVVETFGQQAPPPPVGIWAEGVDAVLGPVDNPLDDYSVVFLPYCDGSVFSGDNVVPDPNWQAFIEQQLNLPPGSGPPVRFHRGLQNATAGIDVAKAMFPKAKKIVVAGSSAGGVGASGFAPFLARMAFGDKRKLGVINDAGPVAINLLDVNGIAARAMDWQFGQFYPASCAACDAFTGQGTAIIKWRLDNDSTIREAFYSTDGDTTNRFFLGVPTQQMYRQLIVSEHGKLNDAHPGRYKRFIRSGDDDHIALQGPTFYLNTANGLPLNEWIEDFLRFNGNEGHDDDEHDHHDEDDDDDHDHDERERPPKGWVDIVEDFVPVPVPAT